MKEKKVFEDPIFEVEKYVLEDVITTSIPGGEPGEGEWELPIL